MSKQFSLPNNPIPASEIAHILETGSDSLDKYLGEQIYFNADPDYIAKARMRLAATARLHAEKTGDKPTVLLRAPGRLNAFLEYLDMCDGDHMSTTIDGDLPICVSIREDDMVQVFHCSDEFEDSSFDITNEINKYRSAPWEKYAGEGLADNWDNRTRVYPYYNHPQGHWLNYIRCSFLRTAWETPDIRLRGVDITLGESTIPLRGGTSSSSALVVLSFLALYLANADQLPSWEITHICKLLGEAEWYVGTHGGANDQTTILRNSPNGVLYNRHSQAELDSTLLPSLKGVKMIVANSLWEASKALNANHIFNLRKGWMDLGDDLMKLIIVDSTPDTLDWKTIKQHYKKFGTLDEGLLGIPNQAIEELINLLPDEISIEQAGQLLNKDTSAMERSYTLPYDYEGGYRPRAAATFFYKENKLGRSLEKIFIKADAGLASSEISLDSLEYEKYQIRVGEILDELQDTLRDDFQVSNYQLDLLLQIAKQGPGYLGGKLTGAGCGGCVTVMIRDGYEKAFCEYLDREYYQKPANFQRYRDTISELDQKMANELQSNLDNALNNIESQRRVVTFSAGAGVVSIA